MKNCSPLPVQESQQSPCQENPECRENQHYPSHTGIFCLVRRNTASAFRETSHTVQQQSPLFYGYSGKTRRSHNSYTKNSDNEDEKNLLTIITRNFPDFRYDKQDFEVEAVFLGRNHYFAENVQVNNRPVNKEYNEQRAKRLAEKTV